MPHRSRRSLAALAALLVVPAAAGAAAPASAPLQRLTVEMREAIADQVA